MGTLKPKGNGKIKNPIVVGKYGAKKKTEQRAIPAKVQSACRDNEWNELVVTAVGSRLVQKINGVVFAEFIDEDAKHSACSGLLALQDHGKGCVAAFKDIRIKHLRPCVLAGNDAPFCHSHPCPLVWRFGM